MRSASLPLRVLLALAFAGLPILVIGIAADELAQRLFPEADATLVAVVAFAATLAWVILLTIVYSRLLAGEAQTLIGLARRGQLGGDAAATDEVQARLLATLEERNRQVAALATDAAAAPISDDPQTVATHVVRSARGVTADPTWSLAVLRAGQDDLLREGVYDGSGEMPSPVEELHRWAAVTTGALPQAQVVEGPWGAFGVAPVPMRGEMSAVLVAPWEGRARPSVADLNLVSLVAEHAGTALEHALLYAKVRSQAEAIERMAAVQSDFLRGVTHDLQTPLTSIRAVANELRSRTSIDGTARDDLDVIMYQADRLRRMVGQLLVASRLEAGGSIQPRQDVFAVAPIIERTWAALRAERPFELTVGGAPHLAVGDPDRFEQVIWAVLDNAVKYSPEEGQVTVAVKPDDGELLITVADHGVGMDAETRRRAFDQFYRADTARRMVPDGSGVGLYAARGLIEAMGGRIAIESALGDGTRVTLALPSEPVLPGGATSD